MNADLLSPEQYIQLEERYTARNYAPLDVVLHEGHGVWVTDVSGKRYFDALAGYSALNFGHCHPELVDVAVQQLHRITLSSRAFRTDQLGLFCRDLAELCGKDKVLPMNSGAEAVESGLKLARRWGAHVKGVDVGQSNIITMADNFHGRTTTIVGFSTDSAARHGFGPFTPGFITVPFGDLDAIEAALDDHTVAILLEPIQGEAGVILPPDGYLRGIREICTRNNVLMVADEIQSGLARTGRTFACDHEDVVPDIYLLGKALGGGLVPLSAVVCDATIMDVFTPGSHGSTFGGNPLACAIGRQVVAMLATGEFQQRSIEIGNEMRRGLEGLLGNGVVSFRQRGAWAGVDIDPACGSGREICQRMAERGVLAKDTHGSTIRLAPPLVATNEEIGLMLDVLTESLQTD